MNLATNGLSNNYELLVELKGEKVAQEFPGAFEACWREVRTLEIVAEALSGVLARAAARKQARRRGSGFAQLGVPSSSDQNREDPFDPIVDSTPKRASK